MTTIPLEHRLELIADAVLAPIRVERAFVSPLALKTALLVLAAYDDLPISNSGLAPRMGSNMNCSGRALRALVSDGLVIRREVGFAKLVAYRVSWDRLLELQTTEPPYRVGGSKPRKTDWANVKQRMNRAAAKERKRQQAREWYQRSKAS